MTITILPKNRDFSEEYLTQLLMRGCCWMVGICAVLIALSWCCMELPPVSTASQKSIQMGMTIEQVQTILGMPSEISRDDEGHPWGYRYSRRWLRQSFGVRFDRDGRVKETELDR